MERGREEQILDSHRHCIAIEEEDMQVIRRNSTSSLFSFVHAKTVSESNVFPSPSCSHADVYPLTDNFVSSLHNGPAINDVCKVFGIFDPYPFIRISCNLSVLLV